MEKRPKCDVWSDGLEGHMEWHKRNDAKEMLAEIWLITHLSIEVS